MNPKLANYLTPIVALFFAAALGVTAATTIGTDIVTGGDLDVTGNSTLTGTLDVTGATTLGDLSAIGTFTASTTAAGSDVNLNAMDRMTLTARNGLTLNTTVGGFTINSEGNAYIGISESSGNYNAIQFNAIGTTMEAYDGAASTITLTMTPGAGTGFEYSDATLYQNFFTSATANYGIGMYADSDSEMRLDANRAVPSTATDACLKGAIRYDASYIYICTATNTWKRATLATW